MGLAIESEIQSHDDCGPAAPYKPKQRTSKMIATRAYPEIAGGIFFSILISQVTPSISAEYLKLRK